MVGHCSDRFEELTDNPRLKQELLCGICRQVIADAIQTQCKHNFCYDCLKQWLTTRSGTADNNNKVCPECGKSLSTRKRKYSQSDENTVEIVPEVWVDRNSSFNNIIGSLKTRCDYHWNGCQAMISLDTLADHHPVCEHRWCLICDQQLAVGEQSQTEHNCVDALKQLAATVTDEKCGLQRQFDEYKKLTDQQIQQLSVTRLMYIINETRLNQEKANQQLIYDQYKRQSDQQIQHLTAKCSILTAKEKILTEENGRLELEFDEHMNVCSEQTKQLAELMEQNKRLMTAVNNSCQLLSEAKTTTITIDDEDDDNDVVDNDNDTDIDNNNDNNDDDIDDNVEDDNDDSD